MVSDLIKEGREKLETASYADVYDKGVISDEIWAFLIWSRNNMAALFNQLETQQATMEKLCNKLDQIASYAYSRANDEDRKMIKEYHKLAQQCRTELNGEPNENN